MANKHLLRLVLFILFNSIAIIAANVENSDKITSIRDNIDYKSKQCECKKVKCYHWINEKNCLLMNGNFKPKSQKSCDCCSLCVIQSGVLESCYHSIPGFKFECIDGSFCSKKDGFICKANNFQSSKQYLKLKKVKYIRPLMHSKQDFYKLFVLNNHKVNERDRPLKRIPRSPYKFSIRLGTKNTTDSEEIEGSAQSAQVQLKKTINAISGGNANSINSNIGPTYIINNNYRYTSGEKPVHHKIKMGKDGNLVFEMDPSSSSTSTPNVNTTTVETITNTTNSTTTTTTTSTTPAPTTTTIATTTTTSTPPTLTETTTLKKKIVLEPIP